MSRSLLKRLSDLSSRLWTTRDLETGLQEMLAATNELLDADMGNIQMLARDRGVLELVAQQGFHPDFLTAFQEVRVDGSTACARATRRAARVVVEDVETDPNFAPILPAMRAAGVRAMQSTPLFSANGEVLGIISSYCATPRKFEEQKLECLDLYAREAAHFIERAQGDVETRKLLRRLDEMQRRLQAVMKAAPVGISYSDDPTCERVTGNSALWRQFDSSPAENISASTRDRGAVGPQIRFYAGDRQVMANELPLQRAVSEKREIAPMEFEVVLPNGRRWHTLASGAPVFGEDGEIIGGVAVTIDITERRRMERALLEADRRKNEFLAVLAHELRNPLAPLRNALYVMRASETPPHATTLVDMMERQVDNLVRLVDDLMEISRITLGKIELRTETLGVADIIRLSVATSAPAVEAGEHTLILSLGDELLTVDGDPTRLAQVLANLLNNAAKFTPRGGRIEVTARRAGDEAVISVRDNGRGIPAELLPRVFDLFMQGASAKERRDGIGVGLALARSIVELHGGRLDASSDGPGSGSVFTLRLPLVAARAPRVRDATPAELPSAKRVLVVDDNQEAADSLVTLLAALREEATAVYSGRAALDAIEAFRPHLAFIDIGMPEMDGWETARRIRQTSHGAAVALVALSGWGRDEDRARSVEAGFHRHLVKPISMAALQECISTATPIGLAGGDRPPQWSS
jgi:signal transduction histidine kinase/ActR/RegA family two-component response regulator